MPKGVYNRPTEEQRFWSKVDIKGEDECWLWLGSKDSDGYGYFTRETHSATEQKGKTIHAHRYSLMLKLQDFNLPTGVFTCHTCDDKYASDDKTYRLCVNPKHLEKGNAMVNSGRMKELNRQATGEKNGNSKLTNQQAKEILEAFEKAKQDNKLYGFNIAMGKKYSVDKQVIYRLTSKQTWTTLE